jgi:large subunit ribosomal protein L21
MSAYAVIETGGKQYRVVEGDVLKIELLDAEAGSQVTFDKVLALSNDAGVTIGTPTVAGATVRGEVVEHLRGPKLIAFKKRRRKNYARKVGHRQELTKVKITGLA